MLDLDRGRAEAVASELDGSVGIACDVADESSVQEAVQAGARAARPDRLRSQRRRHRPVHADRGALARRLEPDARGPPDRNVPRLPGDAAASARRRRRRDREPRVDGGAARASAPRCVRRREGRDHLVLPPARARRRRRQRARERDRTWKRAHADDAAGLSGGRGAAVDPGAVAEPEEIADGGVLPLLGRVELLHGGACSSPTAVRRRCDRLSESVRARRDRRARDPQPDRPAADGHRSRRGRTRDRTRRRVPGGAGARRRRADRHRRGSRPPDVGVPGAHHRRGLGRGRDRRAACAGGRGAAPRRAHLRPARPPRPRVAGRNDRTRFRSRRRRSPRRATRTRRTR